MKPRNVNRFVKIARIMCGSRIGPGDSVVALYIEISPHTGMRANGLSNGNTASNTAPPTFGKAVGEIGHPVVDAVIKPELPGHVAAFVWPARDTDCAGTLDPRDLADDRTDCTR